MKTVEITESNKYLLSALADCPIGTEITFNDGVIEVGKKEFKRGDFLVNESCRYIFIFDDGTQRLADCYLDGSELEFYNPCNQSDYESRFATKEEEQTLIKALNDQGKDWDAEKMEIVDYVWKPKKGDEVFYLDSDMDAVSSYIIFENNFKGNVFDFRTKELAEAALEVLKSLKHY